MNIIGEKLYKALIEEERYLAYLEGLKITIEISLLAILLGVVIGILVAIINVTARERKGLKWLSLVCSLYINIIRGTPLMVQLLIFANLMWQKLFELALNPLIKGRQKQGDPLD